MSNPTIENKKWVVLINGVDSHPYDANLMIVQADSNFEAALIAAREELDWVRKHRGEITTMEQLINVIGIDYEIYVSGDLYDVKKQRVINL